MTMTMTTQRRLSLVAAGSVAGALAVSAFAYRALPEKISGGWGPKAMVFVMPVIMGALMLVMYGFTVLTSRSKPHNVPLMRTLQATVLAIFFALNLVVISTMASMPLPARSISIALGGWLVFAATRLVPRLH
jgi:hypothetical protein